MGYERESLILLSVQTSTSQYEEWLGRTDLRLPTRTQDARFASRGYESTYLTSEGRASLGSSNHWLYRM